MSKCTLARIARPSAYARFSVKVTLCVSTMVGSLHHSSMQGVTEETCSVSEMATHYHYIQQWCSNLQCCSSQELFAVCPDTVGMVYAC